MISIILIGALTLFQPPAAAQAHPLRQYVDTMCEKGDRICLLGRLSLFNSIMNDTLALPDCAAARGEPDRCTGEAGVQIRALFAGYDALRRRVGAEPSPITRDRAFRGKPPKPDDARVQAYLERAMADLARPCKAPEPVCVAGQFALLVDADQLARSAECASRRAREQEACREASLDHMRWIDARTTPWLMAWLDDKGWPARSRYGSDTANNAWLLAQHADETPDLQVRVLALMRTAVAANEASAADLALLEDRVSMKQREVQIYGTQGSCEPEGWKMFPVEAPESLTERRAGAGLPPMAEYQALLNRMCAAS